MYMTRYQLKRQSAANEAKERQPVVTAKGLSAGFNDPIAILDDHRIAQYDWKDVAVVVWDSDNEQRLTYPVSDPVLREVVGFSDCSWLVPLPNNKLACAIGQNILILDLETKVFTRLNLFKPGLTYYMGAFADGKLLTMTGMQFLALWDTNTCEQVKRVTAKFRDIDSDIIDIHGDYFYASASFPGEDGDSHGQCIYQINKKTGKAEKTFESDQPYITALKAISSRYLLAAFSNRIEIYDVEQAKRVRSFLCDINDNKNVVPLNQNCFAVVVRYASQCVNIQIVHCENETQGFFIKPVPDPVLVPLNDQFFAIVSTDGSATIFNLALRNASVVYRHEKNFEKIHVRDGVAFCIDTDHNVTRIDLKQLLQARLALFEDVKMHMMLDVGFAHRWTPLDDHRIVQFFEQDRRMVVWDHTTQTKTTFKCDIAHLIRAGLLHKKPKFLVPLSNNRLAYDDGDVIAIIGLNEGRRLHSLTLPGSSHISKEIMYMKALPGDKLLAVPFRFEANVWDVNTGKRLTLLSNDSPEHYFHIANREACDVRDEHLFCVSHESDEDSGKIIGSKISMVNIQTGAIQRQFHSDRTDLIAIKSLSNRYLAAQYDVCTEIFDITTGQLVREFNHVHNPMSHIVPLNDEYFAMVRNANFGYKKVIQVVHCVDEAKDAQCEMDYFPHIAPMNNEYFAAVLSNGAKIFFTMSLEKIGFEEAADKHYREIQSRDGVVFALNAEGGLSRFELHKSLQSHCQQLNAHQADDHHEDGRKRIKMS